MSPYLPVDGGGGGTASVRLDFHAGGLDTATEIVLSLTTVPSSAITAFDAQCYNHKTTIIIEILNQQHR